MNRVVGVVAAVLVAAVVAFSVMRHAEAPDLAAAPVERLLAAGSVAGARAELASVKADLEPATADYLEGLILLVEGHDAAAVEALSRAETTRPADWRIVNALASALANAGRFPDAVARLEKYVALAPADERGLATLADFLLRERTGKPDPARALELLDRIAALPRRVAPPDDPTAVSDGRLRLLRVKALLELGRNTDALLDARIAVTELPQSGEAWFLLGEAARIAKTGGPKESVDAYRRAMQLEPGNRRYAEHFAMTMIDFGGDAAETLGVAQALAASAPDDPRLQLLVARALVRNERNDEASVLYRELLKRDLPKDVRLDVLRNFGVMLYDWHGGAKGGSEYLDDAYRTLRLYVDDGGLIDEKLLDTWRELEERERAKGK